MTKTNSLPSAISVEAALSRYSVSACYFVGKNEYKKSDQGYIPAKFHPEKLTKGACKLPRDFQIESSLDRISNGQEHGHLLNSVHNDQRHEFNRSHSKFKRAKL